MSSKKHKDWSKVTPVVIDCGTAFTRCGFGGDSTPLSTVATVVGRPRERFGAVSSAQEGQETYIGAEVFKRPAQLSIRYPVENRVFTNFEDTTALLTHIFANEVKVPADKHPLVMTLTSLTPQESKEKILEIIMETFRVPAFYPASPSAACLYAAGVTSGVVVDSGEAGTLVMPVFQGFSMPYFAKKLDVGGRHINDALKKGLVNRGYHLSASVERNVLRDMKEQFCFVSADPEQEENVEEKTFSTPDGMELKISNERFTSPEILFQPSLCGVDAPGTSQMIADVSNSVDEVVRGQLAATVLRAGGSTMFEGYQERVKGDLMRLLPPHISFHVNAPISRKISAWVGCSIISSVSTFSQLWISRQEYEEEGPSVFAIKYY